MYRPEIKILDCTIRDGGLINDCQFEDGFVRAVYSACSAAGVDYIELGYQADKKFFSPDKYGKWKFCEEDDLKRVTEGIESKSKISTMIDIGRVDLDQIKQKKGSLVSMIRTACYVKGALGLLEEIEQSFSLKPGQVSADNKLGVQVARCIGACGLAPAVVLDDEVQGKLTREMITDSINAKIK